MKCYTVPLLTRFANGSLMVLSVTGVYLCSRRLDEYALMMLLSVAFSVMFALNAVWMHRYRICVKGSTIVFHGMLNTVTEVQLKNVVSCKRSRKGLPSISDDDLIMVDSTGRSFKVLGNLEQGPELIAFIERWVANENDRRVN